MKTTARTLLLAPLALALPLLAHAQQLGQPFGATGSGAGPISMGYVDLLAGLTYTDNSLLTAHGKRSDGIGIVGLNVDYARQGVLRLDLLGNIDRLQYIRNSFSGSFYGQFRGDAIWGKPTDPVQWLLADSFGEGQTNPLSAPTPTNLQTINYLTTGPYLNLNFGLTNRFTLYGLYARSTYQRSPYDAQTFRAGAAITHQLAGATSISLHASEARTQYLDQAALINTPGRGQRYDIKQASINFRGQYVRTSLTLAAGYNTINYGGRQHGSPYYDVRLSRSISPFSTLFIGAESFYSTLGASMQSPTAMLGAEGGVTQGAGFITSQPFKARMATAGWSFHRARTTFTLSGIYQEDQYDQQPINNHRDERANLSIGRQLSQTVSLRLQAYGSYDDYTQLDARTHQITATLTLAKQMARTMFALYIRRTQQSGSPGLSNFAAASYHDDQVGVYFTYDLFGQRGPGGSGAGLGMGLPGLPGGF